MKLSEYIATLQDALKHEGDLDVFMASDAEGNDIHSTEDQAIESYSVTHLSPINGDAIVKGVILYPAHDTWDPIER